jgi:ribosomal subunit interface protein
MQVLVSGQGVKIGEALQEYVKDKLIKQVTKYFEQAINAHVVFHKEGVFYKADIIVHEGTSHHPFIKGEAKADEIYAAFDDALEKVDKQLGRYKTRIKNHHKRKLSEIIQEDAVIGTKYIIKPFISEDLDQGESIEDNPIIIAEKPTSIEKLSVADAVMKMDLNGLPAMIFVNNNDNCLNIVYHRPDGNISWIDTKQFISVK